MTELKLVAIDLDGTLVDSAPDLAHCLGRALQSVRLPVPRLSEVRGWIGDGIETLLRRALAAAAGEAADETTFGRAFDVFDECYRRNLYQRSRLYPNVPDTLDALRARGLSLGCVTNKRLQFAKRLLELAGILGRFEFVYGGDSFAEKKPSPVQLEAAARTLEVSADECVLVGDSVHDERAAKAAGFEFIWASYGYGTEPAAGSRSRRIERFDELAALLGER